MVDAEKLKNWMIKRRKQELRENQKRVLHNKILKCNQCETLKEEIEELEKL